MEFTYKVSEGEYLRAWKLKNRGGPLSAIFKGIFGSVLVWFFIFICFVFLWMVSQHGAPSPPVMHHAVAKHVGAGYFLMALARNIGPFVLVAAIAACVLFGFEPRRARHSYRKDPAMHGQFTANITSGSITIHNAKGISTQADADIYEYWIDSKGLIVLGLRSGAYSIVSLAGLTGPQRGELRGILTSALRKK